MNLGDALRQLARMLIAWFALGSTSEAQTLQQPQRARNVLQSAVALVPVSQLIRAVMRDGSVTFCSPNCHDDGAGYAVLRLLSSGRVQAAECDYGCGAVFGAYFSDSPVSIIVHVGVPSFKAQSSPYQRLVLQQHRGQWILCPWMVPGAWPLRETSTQPCGGPLGLFPMHRVSTRRASQLQARMSGR